MYRVKEIFYSLQGEGANSGRPAVFCRFAGCNLWSGREKDRAEAACKFCDTNFVGGARYDVQTLLQAIRDAAGPCRFVVCTGGEPTLQLDEVLIDALHAANLTLAVETNGTQPVPRGVDWITVSPKAGAPLVQREGEELKVVVPQSLDFDALARLPFAHRYVQPMDGREGSVQVAIEHCLRDPRWRLSLQAHKLIGIR